MATDNREDGHFFAIFHLFASFSRVSLGEMSWNVLKLSLVETISDNALIWKNEKFI